MGKTKKKSSAAKNVAKFFITFIILEIILLVGLQFVFKNKDVTPSIGGYSVYMMNSDKMGDSIPKGSLVVATNGTPSKEGKGKAVIVENVGNQGTSVFWLSDVRTTDDKEGVIYTVFQEKSPEKTFDVDKSDIVGTATSYYKTAGNVITFLKTKIGIGVCVLIPMFLFVLIELILVFVGSSDEEKSDTEKDKKEMTIDNVLFSGNNIDIKKAEKEEDSSESQLKDEIEDIKFNENINQNDNDEDVSDKENEDVSDIKDIEDKEEKAEESDDSEEKTYYEKATELIDNAVNEKDNHEQISKSLEDESLKNKVSASFEDLMKLMEQEQNKLENQFDEEI